jgi:Lhr-like helicase
MIDALLDLLATYYQAGDLRQVEVIARSMLHAMPDDVVAMQFLALALHRRGQVADAYRYFRKAAEQQECPDEDRCQSTGELAAAACYRSATRFGSRLAKGWRQIAKLMAHYGFRRSAAQALRSALAATTERRQVFRTAE